MNIVLADAADKEVMLALFPRLASFDIPEHRNPDDLWTSDARMLMEWAAGTREDCFVHVARGGRGEILGVAMVTLRPELLSHSPSAHLEVLVVSEQAEGQGIGAALLSAAEHEARARGALSMSLHVFARNRRARRVYERHGFDGEIIRYIKRFEDDALK